MPSICNPNTPATLSGMQTITPAVSTVFSVPVPQRVQAVVIGDGQKPTVLWTMIDSCGRPVDLEQGSTGSLADGATGVVLKLAEAVAGPCAGVATFDGTVVNEATGQVSAVVDTTQIVGPGIYDAEFAIVDGFGTPLLVNRFMVILEPSLFHQSAYTGPPYLAEIRLQIRDSSPAESRLLDNVTFDDAEMAISIRRPVHYFNEVTPKLDIQYTTQNFPSRYFWIEGIIANLFGLVAEWYRKNHLPYQAGGISVDDMAKAQDYEAAYQAHWKTYTDWVRGTKIQLNQDACWGAVGSPYGLGMGSWNSY